jgi:hypothetical protein
MPPEKIAAWRDLRAQTPDGGAAAATKAETAAPWREQRLRFYRRERHGRHPKIDVREWPRWRNERLGE